MTDWYGWMGTILRIDVTTGKITKEPLTEDLALNYIGGRGINSKILYDETGPDTDPLGPDNRFIIGTGPFTGGFGLGNGRYTLTTKSPLTGILGDGSGGGHFGAEVKYCGYDHVIVQGKSPKPVYIWVHDDEVEIRDASHLWGKTTWETGEAIRAELGDQHIRTLCIGPSAEHLVRYSFALTDDERVAAETGTGCTLGSKNVKALAFRGSKSFNLADPDKYYALVRKWYDDIPKQHLTPVHREMGSVYLIGVFNQVHNLGIRNSQEVARPYEEIANFLPQSWINHTVQRSIACFGCREGCQKYMAIPEGPLTGEKGMRPEYGALCSFCTQLGVFDYAFGLKVTNYANQLGIDCQEMGPTLAMAMECYQRGILTREDTDGLRLEWGNQDVIMEMLRKTAYREGFGDVLADGCINAAMKIGKDADKYAYHIKGKSHCDRLTAYIPSVLGFAMASRGWDHLRGCVFPHISPRTGPPKFLNYDPIYCEAVMDREHTDSATDMVEMCKWLSEFELMDEGTGNADRVAEVLTAVSGFDFASGRMHDCCERLYNLERAYLLRMGMTRDDDIPPRNFTEQPIASGPFKGKVVEIDKFEQMKDSFYELRGGDLRTGAPKRETLEALGMQDVADDLERIGIYSESGPDQKLLANPYTYKRRT